MQDKIKWFGRYLGCKFVTYYPIMSAINEVNAGELLAMGAKHGSRFERKLILKEIEDISDEDYLELCKVVYGNDEQIAENKSKFVYHWTLLSGAIGCNPMKHAEEIDFLRSKGYAIGIPKEYYITEKELNK